MAPAVNLFGIIAGHKEDDRDEDAFNTCSRCEAGEPKAADGCHPYGRSEAASSAKKAHDVGEAMVIAVCQSWPLRHSHARSDA